MRLLLIAGCALVVFTGPLVRAGRGKGQGAIVNRDKVPVYASASATEPVALLNRGKAVAAISGNVLLAPNYRFDETEGRVRINYFSSADDRGRFHLGWIDPRALSRFTYDCDCAPEKSKCTPFDVRGLKFSFAWNACFEEARDAKLDDLGGVEPARETTMEAGDDDQTGTVRPSGAAELPRDQAPTAAGTLCASNFSSSGSMVRGATFRTFAEWSDTTPAKLFETLLRVLPEHSLAAVSKTLSPAGWKRSGGTRMANPTGSISRLRQLPRGRVPTSR